MCIVPTSLFVQICLEFCRKTVRVLCAAMFQNRHNQLRRLAGMGHCRYKLANLGGTLLVQVYHRHLPPLWLFAAVTILTSRPGVWHTTAISSGFSQTHRVIHQFHDLHAVSLSETSVAVLVVEHSLGPSQKLEADLAL